MAIDYKADYLKSLGSSRLENEDLNVLKNKNSDVLENGDLNVLKNGNTINYRNDFLNTQERVDVALANNGPTEEPPTAFDRIFIDPLRRAGKRQTDIGTRIAQQYDYTDHIKGYRGEDGPYDYSKGTDLPSVLLQTVGNPVSLGFDVAANAITVGAEKAFGLLPESAQEGAYEFLQNSLQTEAGQQALAAISSGEEAWDKFSKANPNEAANYSAIFNITAGLPRTLSGPFSSATRPNLSPDLKPTKISKMGTRKVTEPLAGIDKDIYNIAFSTNKKRPEQALLTTDPQGPLAVQRQLATKGELEVVDELKKAGVRGSKTLQQNLNATTAYLDSLEKPLIALAKKTKELINPESFNLNLKNVFKQIREDYPSVFNNKEASKKFSKNYQQMVAEIKKQGNTAEGLINARRIFDDIMKRQGVDVSSASLNSSVLSAKALRIAVNETLFEVLPQAKEIFKRQSRILSVQDTIAIKAAEEAKSGLGRYIQTLGLDKLVANTGISIALNFPFAALGGIVASPFVFMKNALQTTKPAQIRARVAYVLRDVSKEIEKGLKRIKDPSHKKMLLDMKPAVFSSLVAAGEQLIAISEEKETEEEENQQTAAAETQ